MERYDPLGSARLKHTEHGDAHADDRQLPCVLVQQCPCRPNDTADDACHRNACEAVYPNATIDRHYIIYKTLMR